MVGFAGTLTLTPGCLMLFSNIYEPALMYRLPQPPVITFKKKILKSVKKKVSFLSFLVLEQPGRVKPPCMKAEINFGWLGENPGKQVPLSSFLLLFHSATSWW